MAKRAPLTDAELVEVIEASVVKDWRAAAWLLNRRKSEKPAAGRDGVDELAGKRKARRKKSA